MSKKIRDPVKNRQRESVLADRVSTQAGSSLVVSDHQKRETAIGNVLGIEILSNPRDADIE
jgi:hypothetical protein